MASVLGLIPARAIAAGPPPALAPTPPMGWSSRDGIECSVNEATVKAAADTMVSSGLVRLGYEYVLVDDCWQGARNADGFIQADVGRFPSGMRALVDYVHAKGLRVGLHSGAGNTTCDGRPGSRGHEYQDALQFARWGVDHVTYDACSAPAHLLEEAYATMHDALVATKRDMTLAIQAPRTSEPWKWGAAVGQLWRTTDALTSCFTCIEHQGMQKALGILPAVDEQEGLRSFAGPGHWNDPGRLLGGGLSPAEQRAQFSLWSILAAPLVIGFDLATMAESTREALTNPEAIAVDQDILGVPGFRYRTDGTLDVWMRPLSRGQLAVLFLNRGTSALDIAFDWAKQRVKDDLAHKHYDFATTVFSVRDVWGHRQLETTETPLSTTLQSHDAIMLRLTPQK